VIKRPSADAAASPHSLIHDELQDIERLCAERPAPASFSGQTTPQSRQSEIDSADRLFQPGKFAEAGKLYSQIAAQNPKELFIRRRRQAQPSKDKAETYTS
jgi:hypothetical protein